MTLEEKIKLAKENRHIPTSEIEQDIQDTKMEIKQLTEEADHLEKTPLSMREAKLDHMRASAKRSNIKERQDFIEKLEAILEVRNEIISDYFN